MILDPGVGELGASALGLIARGIDPLYAADLDEAQLLLGEERRVGALVLPGTLPLASLDAALDRLASQLRGGTAAVVIVRPPRERAHLRALRDRKIQWVVRPPFDTAELRFAVSAALASADELDPRTGLRVPMRLPARVRADGAEVEGRILDLSLSGAYVALPEPPAVGRPVLVQLAVGDRAVALEGRVVHRLAEPEPGRAADEPGIGISFRPPAERDQRILECFVRARVDSFRL